MSIATKYLKQDAVWWGRTGIGPSGDPTYADPVDVKCRWDDVHELFLDRDGTQQVSNAIVMVDRHMEPDDVLAPGLVADLEPGVDPLQQPGARIIRKFESNPDIKARNFVRTAVL